LYVPSVNSVSAADLHPARGVLFWNSGLLAAPPAWGRNTRRMNTYATPELVADALLK
jgi:hypothetical protein